MRKIPPQLTFTAVLLMAVLTGIGAFASAYLPYMLEITNDDPAIQSLNGMLTHTFTACLGAILALFARY